MRIGIIAEGKADIAVITNILRALDIDSSNIKPLRPNLRLDESDKSDPRFKHLQEDEFGSWTNVRRDCISREPFEDFFGNSLDDKEYIIVQLDSAEADEYEVSTPTDIGKSNPEYFSRLRNSIIDKIQEWLQSEANDSLPFADYQDKLLYAIAIEEIDAWVLAIYENKSTGSTSNPKEKLRYVLKHTWGIEKAANMDMRAYYDDISKPFVKAKKGKNNLKSCLAFNKSLEEFVESIKNILTP